ncbi:MAG: 2-oxoglutarate oxidoreductase subunit KorA [Lentisphaerae bacterium ADurb.Bin242]|nr:MAG: 2-oxoglutarate oxidoreductase subunit KorA [Lentisphaerae bacterium ADurb.Bin242]
MEYSNKLLLKGNEAVVFGALLAGCDCFFGYPITPASEIAQTAAEYFPKLGRPFLQAECETASINMVLGASAAGRRVMTASSGLGISLKQEGVSYIATMELPCVIVDIMRGGPGLGNIAPEQSDYNQVVKGGGHGGYKVIVLAPSSAQEMCDFARLAFELADKYRIPVYVLTDGVIGQMLESVALPEPLPRRESPDWALDFHVNPRTNCLTSIYMEPDDLEELNHRLNAKYAEIEEKEAHAEEYRTDDAEILVAGFGICGRIIRTAIDRLRAGGVKAGMIRPVTLFPFPKKAFTSRLPHAKQFVSVEMNNGQMIDDIRLTIECSRPVSLLNRMGGNLPSVEEVVRHCRQLAQGGQ